MTFVGLPPPIIFSRATSPDAIPHGPTRRATCCTTGAPTLLGPGFDGPKNLSDGGGWAQSLRGR
ncbi:MAG: hypothetical protein CM15mP79_0410 [Methanobacteriota archaeon]|nr:MAG: hypothetical protein CM15mP79_0410 [Euryarchaeota archaeon]